MPGDKINDFFRIAGHFDDGIGQGGFFQTEEFFFFAVPYHHHRVIRLDFVHFGPGRVTVQVNRFVGNFVRVIGILLQEIVKLLPLIVFQPKEPQYAEWDILTL